MFGEMAAVVLMDMVVTGGQGNPPELLAGTDPLIANVGVVPLVQLPVTLAGPVDGAVALHVDPKSVNAITRPFCGMVSVAVGVPPLYAMQIAQAPLATTVAELGGLVVHMVKVGVPIGMQTGPEEFELAGAAGTVPIHDMLQVTVSVPNVKVTFVDGAIPFAVAVKLAPAGVTVVDWANAGEAPSQITAAIAGATR